MNRQINQFAFKSILLFVAVAVLTLAFHSRAQTNSSFDAAAASPTAIYAVTTINDSGAGFLRQAITVANASAGADRIRFSITPITPFTMFPPDKLTLRRCETNATFSANRRGFSQSLKI